MKEDITKRIDNLNDELKVRQESIDLLKGRLKSQITSFRETIAKVLDKDTSLAEKIRTLFREQGIMIASILTAIGMVHVQNFGGWQAISLVFKPPTLRPSPQIFSVVSDTSCHTPYLFFKNTNCVTPPQIIRRFPQNFDFPKTLICSNCKTKRYF